MQKLQLAACVCKPCKLTACISNSGEFCAEF